MKSFTMNAVYLAASLILVCVNVCSGQTQQFRDVETLQGPVRGYKDPVGPFVFYGIPYATPPTGVDKFKAPLPPPTWNTTYEAVEKNIICPQVGNGGVNAEDCLIINVFTPDTNDTNLPVYVIIHGGGFETGYGNLGTPKAFVESKNVVAVTFNYRLGIHGFLCLGTEKVPGNAGLKDMVAALRWVKENIGVFGGNNEDVTIGGYSAGGTAVDLLMLSKSAEGLFNKAIPESVWAHYQDPMESATKQAEELNFNNTNDLQALEEFYTTTDLSILLSNNRYFYFCVEKESEDAFLDKAPTDIIEANEYNKVPILYSFCNKEGLTKVKYFTDEIALMNKDFSAVLPKEFDFKTGEKKDEIARIVKEFYFGDKPAGTDTINEFINFESDMLFIYAVMRSVKLHVQAGHDHVYLYEYSFPHEYTVLGDISIVGSNHTTQSMAIFDEDEDSISEEYRQTKAMLRDVYYTFMTTGTPVTPDSFSWPEVTSTSNNNLSFVNVNLNATLQDNLGELEERITFWDDLYAEYYAAPVPPSLDRDTSASTRVTDSLMFVIGFVILKLL